jgi:hypothetical protein
MSKKKIQKQEPQVKRVCDIFVEGFHAADLAAQ